MKHSKETKFATVQVYGTTEDGERVEFPELNRCTVVLKSELIRLSSVGGFTRYEGGRRSMIIEEEE